MAAAAAVLGGIKQSSSSITLLVQAVLYRLS
jgi:hypothetical protein